MNDLAEAVLADERVSAADLPAYLASPPARSSHDGRWRGLTAHHFVDYPCQGSVNLPALREDLVLVHLKSSMPLERRSGSTHDRGMSLPGQITVQPLGQPSHWNWQGRPELLLLHPLPAALREISAALSEQDPDSIVLTPRFAATDPLLHELARALLEDLQDGSALGCMYAEALVQALLARLLRQHSNLLERYRFAAGGLDDKRLRRALDFIHTNLERDLSISQLAQAVHLSPFHFARSFKASTGRAPHVFVVERRIEQAKRLLSSTRLSVAEVCQRCGFQSPSHFAILFRRTTGLSPNAFRSRC